MLLLQGPCKDLQMGAGKAAVEVLCRLEKGSIKLISNAGGFCLLSSEPFFWREMKRLRLGPELKFNFMLPT